jgi:homocysteine S-methyltransferase
MPIKLDREGMPPLISDGSMAVELAQRGFAERPPDRYNLTSPMVVERIHHDFLEAGATLLQSNTQHANRYALEAVMLSARVPEINRKGVWLARQVSAGRVPVAGVIGPTGRLLAPLGTLHSQEVRASFQEQAVALLSAGCDLVLLKSFIDLDELELAIEAVRMHSAEIPVVALKSFPEDGSVLAGSYPADVAERMTRHGVQAIGSSGTVGPQRMLGIVDALRSAGMPLVAIPDVGIPTMVDGTPVFEADPQYVAAAAGRLVEHGAGIVGADGGATVEYIRAIAEIVNKRIVGTAPTAARLRQSHARADAKPEPPTQWHQALTSRFVSTVELDIPRGLDMQSVIEGARYLREHGVDAVNISDGARARLRMSSIAISKLVQEQTGMECLTHLACRDRNMVGLQSELLGAHAMGVRNILAVTGDPTHIGDFPVATSVYDVDAIGLVRSLGRMNAGMDLMGNPLGQPTTFSIACAVNPAADDVEREIDRLAQKAEQGAHVAFSQPMFEAETVERFLERVNHINIRFVLGVLPLRSVRHAEFLHFEVPGMHIPAWVREHMQAHAGSPEEASEAGVHLAVELLRSVRHLVGGVYLMPPFKKYDVAVTILEQL